MISAIVAALEQRPKRLHAVCIGLASHIFPGAVPNRHMGLDGGADIAAMIVRVERGGGVNPLVNYLMQNLFENRIKEWLIRADSFAKKWTPSNELFLNG